MALREQGLMAPVAPVGSVQSAGGINKPKPRGIDPVDKMVQDVVSDKAGNPGQIKPKVKKIADRVRASAAVAAKSGDIVTAIDKAEKASEITQIANRR